MIATAIPPLSRDSDCKAGIHTQGCQLGHSRVLAALQPLEETTLALPAALCTGKAALLPPLGCERTNHEEGTAQGKICV